MRNNSESAMPRMPPFWSHRVIYCICGHLLVESESSQIFHRWRLDALSIPHYVIRDDRPCGARHGKTEAQKEHFLAHNARKRCIKKNMMEFKIHFQETQFFVIRSSKKWLDRADMHPNGLLAQEDNFYKISRKEYLRCQKTLVSHTQQFGQECTDATSIRLAIRSLNFEPVSTENLEKNDLNLFFNSIQGGNPSSSSSSWWNWDHVQKLVELTRIIHFFKKKKKVCCCRFRLQLIANGCNR